MGIAKPAGRRGSLRTGGQFHFHSSGGVCPGVQNRQVCLYSGIIDAQEFGCASHCVDVKVLALSPLFVHKPGDGIKYWRIALAI